VPQRGVRDVLVDLASAPRDVGAIDESECFIDATFASAKWSGEQIGPTKHGKGVRIVAIVDRHGLQLAVNTRAANHHKVTLVQLSFKFYIVVAKPDNLIGNRAFDSDKLDDQLREEGIEMIAPHRKNRVKARTQDSRRLRRYERRWVAERFFAWIRWQRRFLVRWEYYAENFLGIVQFASIAILLKQFLDRF
jgi:transposase